jgi:hypothetical protein
MDEVRESIATKVEACAQAYLRRMRNLVQLMGRVQTVPMIDLAIAFDDFALTQMELLSLQVLWKESLEIPLDEQRKIRVIFAHIVRVAQQFDEGVVHMRSKLIEMQNLMNIARAGHSTLNGDLLASVRRRGWEVGASNVVAIGTGGGTKT